MIITDDGGQIDPLNWDINPLKKGVNASELRNILVALMERMEGVQ